MCRTSAASGASANTPSAGPQCWRSPASSSRRTPSSHHPSSFELVQRQGRRAGVRERRVVDRRSAEVRCVAHREDADDHVSETPGDCGERCRARLRERPIDLEVTGACRHRGRGQAAGADAPGARDWLPEVLIVGEPSQARVELVLPVPLELIAQKGIPGRHGTSLTPYLEREPQRERCGARTVRRSAVVATHSQNRCVCDTPPRAHMGRDRQSGP